MAIGKHGLNNAFITGENGFHRAIRAVANPAAEAQLACAAARPGPIANALHATMDDEMDGAHLSSL